MVESQIVRAAFYARVSSEQQAQQKTIDSQVEALIERVGEDGLVVDDELRFIDDGYSLWATYFAFPVTCTSVLFSLPGRVGRLKISRCSAF
jgi:hypothetical protein